MTPLLTAALREIDLAAAKPVAESECALSRVVSMLSDLPAIARACPESERHRLRVQVFAIHARLANLDRVMARSADIFHGYTRRATSSRHEYTPCGMADTARDPAFIAFSF